MDMDFKSDYKLRRVVFGADLVKDCNNYDEEDISLIGFTHCFIQMYLPCDKDWLHSFTRVYQKLDAFGDYYLVRVFMRKNGVIQYDSYGAARELSRASDYACYHLAQKLFDEQPGFIMVCLICRVRSELTFTLFSSQPPYLIGFPNVRGHCYLISAVMPIFYSYPIVKAIFDGYQFYCKNTNLNGSCMRRPGSKPGRPIIEAPYYWVKSLYDIFKDFHKVSCEGRLPLVNVGFLQKRLFPELKNDPEFPDRAQKPDRDLLLDTRLIKGLCSIMSDYCDKRFGIPGGDEGYAYRHIISKLVSQLPELCDDLMLSIEAQYLCSFCVGGPFFSKFTFPVIMVRPGQNFQCLLDSAEVCANAQCLIQPHDYNEIRCAGKVRLVEVATFLNRPKVLCFSVSPEGSSSEVLIPSTLHFNFAQERHTYKLLCSSVCFPSYQSKDGVDYEEFYHEFTDGDQEVGWHTYTHMETKQGAYEVNNGMIYNVDTRVYKIVTPSSMHFYQLEEFDEFKPDLKRGCVKDKPQHVPFRVSPELDVTPIKDIDTSSDC